MRAIGLMSGTSMDGVDVALLETDGERIETFGPTGYRAYTAEERAVLRAALEDAKDLMDRDERPGRLSRAEEIVTRAHAEAVEEFCRTNGIGAQTIDAVGFHGQTVLHRPEMGLTVQIGDAELLSARLKMPVVSDFRAADVAAGGQGAPLVPVFHRALADYANLPRPVAILNIGGVANVTWVGQDGELVAFDTGPGNALLDDLVRARTGAPFDNDGALARTGCADMMIVAKAMSLPFFLKSSPKSLDRNEFSSLMEELDVLSTPDAAATLVAFTAESISHAVAHMPSAPVLWLAAGGGVRNSTLVDALRARLDTPLQSAEEYGFSPDSLEAQAFAYLAIRSLSELPLTFPGTTGVREAMLGGIMRG